MCPKHVEEHNYRNKILCFRLESEVNCFLLLQNSGNICCRFDQKGGSFHSVKRGTDCNKQVCNFVSVPKLVSYIKGKKITQRVLWNGAVGREFRPRK